VTNLGSSGLDSIAYIYYENVLAQVGYVNSTLAIQSNAIPSVAGLLSIGYLINAGMSVSYNSPATTFSGTALDVEFAAYGYYNSGQILDDGTSYANTLVLKSYAVENTTNCTANFNTYQTQSLTVSSIFDPSRCSNNPSLGNTFYCPNLSSITLSENVVTSFTPFTAYVSIYALTASSITLSDWSLDSSFYPFFQVYNSNASPTLTIPTSLAFNVPNDFFYIDNLSDTYVNALLAMYVATGCTSGNIVITGASPTGQGIVDKAALIANGVTVSTN
jgi:hypothetical protein